ncbi:phage terminase large subunit family protein [Shewanella profunda]|uniref:phage terminase large subunit family protein n=1 Tax=Shewanella profunda TaxID=254793 RepID=UPI002010006E|nr:phage terminase large subunit family protein [Shewanella profunda]MCL1089177.1 phage terminase large subunit family protein [Shewanella profunda]
MLCSHCSRHIKVRDITQQRGKGFHAQVQCPHCAAWLGHSPTLVKLKLLGFYISVFVGLYSYFDESVRYFLIPVMIFSLMLLFVSHFMDQVITIEAPEKVDDSDQRQKYR